MHDVKTCFTNKKIALVGNADSLSRQLFGKKIDNHEIICRINKGPLTCCKDTHGIRTDILFYGNSEIIIPEVTDILGDTVLYVLTHTKFKNSQFLSKNSYEFTQERVDIFKSIVGYTQKGKWPSTGLSAVMFILEHNPLSLSLFGFDWGTTPTFYQKDEITGGSRHDWNLEKSYIFSQKQIQVF
jgi:hypothetical protein